LPTPTQKTKSHNQFEKFPKSNSLLLTKTKKKKTRKEYININEGLTPVTMQTGLKLLVKGEHLG